MIDSIPMYANICSSAVKNRLGIPCRPSFCTYLVTWRCNARCVMCDIWKNRVDDREEMTPAEVKRAFNGIGRLDAIRISGGEPFVRRDLKDIVHNIYEASKPRIVHITTNGLLTDRIVEFMESVDLPGRIHLKVSIDAAGERNSAIRGVPGAYESAVDTLDRLAPMRKKLGFVLGVNQTIVDGACADDSGTLRKLCDGYGIGLYQIFAFDNHVSLYSKGEQLPNTYDRIKKNFPKDELVRQLKDMKAGFRTEDFNEKLSKYYYLRGMYDRLVKGRNSPNPPCVELSSHVRLLPNGDIPICLIYDTIVGNAVSDDFNELWRSPRIKEHRKTTRSCKGCWVGCEIIPNGIYTGDIIKGLLP